MGSGNESEIFDVMLDKSTYLRMYCIDTPGVPESSDAGIFHP